MDGCHGRHLENLFFASFEPKGQLTCNLVRSIGVTCRSKIAKIVHDQIFKIAPMAAILKICFFISSPELNSQLKLCRKHRGDWYIKNS